MFGMSNLQYLESVLQNLLFDRMLSFSNTVTPHSIGCWPVVYCMVFTFWSLCSNDDSRWLHYFTWVYIRRYWAKGEDIQTTDQPSKFYFLWETHESIISSLSWLAVLLIGTFATTGTATGTVEWTHARWWSYSSLSVDRDMQAWSQLTPV